MGGSSALLLRCITPRATLRLPIVHVQKESRGRVIQLIAHDLLQLLDQLIVVRRSQTAELLQKRHIDVGRPTSVAWVGLLLLLLV